MKSYDYHYNFRLSKNTHERIEILKKEMDKKIPGVEIDRTKVVRVIVDRGLAILEKEFNIK